SARCGFTRNPTDFIVAEKFCSHIVITTTNASVFIFTGAIQVLLVCIQGASHLIRQSNWLNTIALLLQIIGNACKQCGVIIAAIIGGVKLQKRLQGSALP